MDPVELTTLAADSSNDAGGEASLLAADDSGDDIAGSLSAAWTNFQKAGDAEPEKPAAAAATTETPAADDVDADDEDDEDDDDDPPADPKAKPDDATKPDVEAKPDAEAKPGDAPAPVAITEEQLKSVHEKHYQPLVTRHKGELEALPTTLKSEFGARANAILARCEPLEDRIAALEEIGVGNLSPEEADELNKQRMALQSILDTDDRDLRRDYQSRKAQLEQSVTTRQRDEAVAAHVDANEELHPELKPFRAQHLEATKKGLTFDTAEEALDYFQTRARADSRKAGNVKPGAKPQPTLTRAQLEANAAAESMGQKRRHQTTAGKGGSGGGRDGGSAGRRSSSQVSVETSFTSAFAREGLDMPK